MYKHRSFALVIPKIIFRDNLIGLAQHASSDLLARGTTGCIAIHPSCFFERSICCEGLERKSCNLS